MGGVGEAERRGGQGRKGNARMKRKCKWRKEKNGKVRKVTNLIYI